MLTPAEAAALIEKHAPRFPVQPIALRDAAGHVLRQDVVAERDQPPFDRVSMDGIALSSKTTKREFKIVGTQAAGAPPLTLDDVDTCLEAMTGAMLPVGCDCVVPIEKLSVKDGTARLADDVVPTPWLNLHRRGIDCRAGAQVLKQGAWLQAPEVAVLASAGIVHVQVTRMPRIVVISTGDELVEPSQPIKDWQIRRSNVYAVVAALRMRGFMRVADDHIADDQSQLRTRLKKHLEDADVLILSGGVSMGKFDFVPAVLAELGVRQIFHKIAQRPGKPMWFGVREDKCVYALPGNPVSTLACMARYVMPGLQTALGFRAEPLSVTLSESAACLPALATLFAVHVQHEKATAVARPMPTQGSGDFTSLLGSSGFVELPPGNTPIPSGTVVKFYRW